MNIGVLALQGDFEEHLKVLTGLGVQAHAVRLPDQLQTLDGLIIPGGESTTLDKLLKIKKMDRAIIDCFSNGLHMWGTCAGLVLLGGALGIIDIGVERNGYGTHSHSFTAKVPFLGKSPNFL